MRTTSVLVKTILEVDPKIPVEPFIAVASELVEEYCTPAGYSESRLELIERFLSAHFYSIRDKPTGSESAGVSQSFNVGQLGKYLESTTYGQQALVLDSKKTLALFLLSLESGRSNKVFGIWSGTP